MPQSVGVQISASVDKLAVLFSMENDPVHFARTLLTVTLKQIHHFKCKQSEIAAAITMSTDCNLQISLSMNWFAFIFGRTHLFFRNTDPSDVSFLKKQIPSLLMFQVIGGNFCSFGRASRFVLL